MTTAHSFKGYEAEIIVVAAADSFCAKPAPALPAEPLPEVLYVAMTRARSMLWLSGTSPEPPPGRAVAAAGEQILAIVETVSQCQQMAVEPQRLTTPGEDRIDLLARIGTQHREWLETTLGRSRPRFGRILGSDGQVLAEPLFWFVHRKRRIACFATKLDQPAREQLERAGIEFLQVGDTLPDSPDR